MARISYTTFRIIQFRVIREPVTNPIRETSQGRRAVLARMRKKTSSLVSVIN